MAAADTGYDFMLISVQADLTCDFNRALPETSRMLQGTGNLKQVNTGDHQVLIEQGWGRRHIVLFFQFDTGTTPPC